MKRNLVHGSLGLLVSLATVFAADSPAEHLWRERVLVVATPSLADERYREQAARLLPAASDLAAERTIIVVALPGAAERQRVPLKDDDFVVWLIGLDGGIKLARREPVSPDVLQRELTGTSLRRSELKSAERARLKGDAAASAAADELKQKLAPSAPSAVSGAGPTEK